MEIWLKFVGIWWRFGDLMEICGDLVDIRMLERRRRRGRRKHRGFPIWF